jgi:hypothetical protein
MEEPERFWARESISELADAAEMASAEVVEEREE